MSHSPLVLVACRAILQDQHCNYWRCHNKGSEQYMLVRYTYQHKAEVEAWLNSVYQVVELVSDTLPYWRLYQAVPEDLDMSWF